MRLDARSLSPRALTAAGQPHCAAVTERSDPVVDHRCDTHLQRVPDSGHRRPDRANCPGSSPLDRRAPEVLPPGERANTSRHPAAARSPAACTACDHLHPATPDFSRPSWGPASCPTLRTAGLRFPPANPTLNACDDRRNYSANVRSTPRKGSIAQKYKISFAADFRIGPAASPLKLRIMKFGSLKNSI